MPCLLTPSDLPLQNDLVFFEVEKSETTVLGNSTNEHQKAFLGSEAIQHLGSEAIQFGYVMLASDGMPAGGLLLPST